MDQRMLIGRLDDAIAALGAAIEMVERGEFDTHDAVFIVGELYATLHYARGLCMIARMLAGDAGDEG